VKEMALFLLKVFSAALSASLLAKVCISCD
jgi:hypothetical protein